ncbi:MAG TPA: ricin-type beta-trefoil lectin domain protein, partial [Rugosimonospora sp.]|nr:ricin-type beta-trefoil lectin domain protein [Rugosimonospora sp.]
MSRPHDPATPLPRPHRWRPRARHAAALLLSVALSVAGLALSGTGAQAAAGTALYTPNISANPGEDASYPRVIRLAHSGTANGTLLATFAHSGISGVRANFPIYRSTDDGHTWTGSPIGTVTDTRHGWDLDGPTLFELPAAAGNLPAGTLFASGTAWAHGDYTQQDMEVFVSTDHGVTWSYRSSCTAESGMANSQGHGIWEPYFAIAGNGNLVCYFSDERPVTSGYPQVLAHVVSTDGGATWSSEVWDVALQDNVSRPGMTTVVRLPNGGYAMTYEDCKAGYDPDQACSVYFKTSPDGLSWTPVNGLGTLVQTADGRHLLHTPYLTWTPQGGPNGTLLVSGQRVVAGPDGSLTVLAESGRVLFANTNNGSGAWTETTAPVTVDPTGGYDAGETSCPGYSSPLLASFSYGQVLNLAGTHLGNGKCEVRYAFDDIPGPTGAITGPGSTGQCVDVDTNTAVSGNRVQLWTCNTATGQQWSMFADGTVRAFGKCLDIVGNGTANFTKVQLWDCNGVGGQQWRSRADGSLYNPQSGRCLDDPNAITTNGTQLQIYDCNGLFTQVWHVPGAPTGPVTGPAGTQKCMDVDTNTPTSGNKVQLWTCNGVTGQQWQASPDGTLRAFGKCLDIVGNGTANFTKVQLW